MSLQSPSLGVLSKLLIKPGASTGSPPVHDFASGAFRLDFIGESIQRKGRIIGGQGITGLTYRLADRSRQGGYRVGGSFLTNPSPATFEQLLPLIVGPKVDGVFTPGNCPPVFGMLLNMGRCDEGTEDTWEWIDCRVDSWILRGKAPAYDEQGEPELLQLQINVIAADEYSPNSVSPYSPPTWPVSPPALGSGITYAPYMLQDSDGGLTIYGSTRKVYEFALAWNNNLDVKFANSLSANSISPGMRDVRVKIRLPWTSENQDLYDQAFAGDDATFAFVLQNMSTTMSVFNLQVPPESPYVEGKESDATFTLNGVAGGSSTTPELLVTNDYTNT